MFLKDQKMAPAQAKASTPPQDFKNLGAYSIGGFSLVSHPKTPGFSAPATEENTRKCICTLRILNHLLPQSIVEWQLAGGSSVAVLSGQFSRNHGDIDIQVDVNDALKLALCLESSGLHLSEKKLTFRTKPGRNNVILKAVSPNNLRIKPDTTYRIWLGNNPEHFPYIDVYFCHPKNDNIDYCDHGRWISMPRSQTEPIPSNLQNTELLVRSPKVTSALLGFRLPGRKAIHDLGLLEKLGFGRKHDN